MNDQLSARRVRGRREWWTTVAVTALPLGWRNVYHEPGDAHALWEVPCPALLLQECREEFVDYTDNTTRREACQPPYDTRVVYAGPSDMGWPEVGTAECDNYLGTIGPGETVETLRRGLESEEGSTP